jgi:hypothetical protein
MLNIYAASRMLKKTSSEAAGDSSAAGVPFHPPSPEPADAGSFPWWGTLRTLVRRERSSGRSASRRHWGGRVKWGGFFSILP